MTIDPRMMPEQSLSSKGLDLLHANSLWLNGKRVPLLSGEVQFFRMEPAAWEPSLRAVKQLGLPIVSTYLSWRRFSPEIGKYDLTGQTNPRLNVRHFLDLCREIGLWVTIKPGPWICAEETNGGYPDWLVSLPELQVRDANDQPVQGYMGPFQSPIPSYLHPAYQLHVRGWLEAVDQVIRPYIYPNGPVVLIQLDNEPCFTFHDRMFESDYNLTVASPGGLYSRWLQQKYRRLVDLPDAYAGQGQSFDEFTPPRSLEINSLKELPRYFDWAEFKEWLLAEHISSIGEHHLRNGLDRVLFTSNFNEHPQLAVPNNWRELEAAAGLGGYDYYPHMPMQFDDFCRVVQAVNFSRSVLRAPWSPEMMTGIWSFEGQEHRPDDLAPEDFQYLYLTCLAYGLKGMNFYMLADRDNWVGSPLNEKGEITPASDAVQIVVRLMQALPDFFDLQKRQPVAVVYYRPYAREAFIANESRKQIDGYCLGEAYARFEYIYKELLAAKCDPGIVDLWANASALRHYKLVILPPGPYMDRDAQQALADYVEAGGQLVICGEPPALGSDFAPVAAFDRSGQVGSGPRSKHAHGKGYWYELSSSRPSREVLTALLEEAGALPEPLAAAPGVLATFHAGVASRVLFVINTKDAPAAAGLTFRTCSTGHLSDVLQPGATLPVSLGKVLVDLPARSVRVFELQDNQPNVGHITS